MPRSLSIKFRQADSGNADSMSTAWSVARAPEPHARFLARASERLQEDERLIGLAIGGSYLTSSMDEFSDLDLVIAVEPAVVDAVLAERRVIAERLGPLLAAFTGEHVGEPRLLICLYDSALLHVDLKFVSLSDAAIRIEDPAIVWERERRFSRALRAAAPRPPRPDLQWLEDRFWVWIHYVAVKIGRGELFEAINFLAFLRTQVLGPLALLHGGAQPTGVRKLEALAPDFVDDLQRTIATYSTQSCLAALRAAAVLYRRLRDALACHALRRNPGAEAAVLAYLTEMDARHDRT